MTRAMALALLVVVLPFASAAADEANSAAARIEKLVRGLDSDDPAVRAKAALDLGETFPHGAVAVPVLLDARDDDEAAVRSAAVRALRRLGRAGLDEAAKQLPTLDKGALDALSWTGAVAHLLGAAVTPTDLASGVDAAADRGPSVLRGMLWTIAGCEMPHGDFAHIVERWLGSSDASLALAAA